MTAPMLAPMSAYKELLEMPQSPITALQVIAPAGPKARFGSGPSDQRGRTKGFQTAVFTLAEK